jgi:hypothetical protein
MVAENLDFRKCGVFVTPHFYGGIIRNTHVTCHATRSTIPSALNLLVED